MTPDEDFSFRSLLKPGEGAVKAIERHVATLTERERFTPGQWYGGKGELLKTHGVYFKGQPLPEQYARLRGEPTRCHVNALVACEQEPTLRYFTGLYAAGPDITDHSWCVAPEGGVVELTFPTDARPGARLGRQDEMGRTYISTLGWTPPETWGYVGLEFDVEFVRRFYDETKCLPLLDLPPAFANQPYLKAYTPKGFALPTDEQMEAWEASLRIPSDLPDAEGDVDPDEEWPDDDDE